VAGTVAVCGVSRDNVPRVPELLQMLQYQYVDDMADKRGPHRPGHVDLINRYHGDGRLVVAGALGDPVHGGLLAFRTRDDAEAFVNEDPYNAAGLVVEWKVDPWNVVTT
jgi:uncharacterized protein